MIVGSNFAFTWKPLPYNYLLRSLKSYRKCQRKLSSDLTHWEQEFCYVGNCEWLPKWGRPTSRDSFSMRLHIGNMSLGNQCLAIWVLDQLSISIDSCTKGWRCTDWVYVREHVLWTYWKYLPKIPFEGLFSRLLDYHASQVTYCQTKIS